MESGDPNVVTQCIDDDNNNDASLVQCYRLMPT